MVLLNEDELGIRHGLASLRVKLAHPLPVASSLPEFAKIGRVLQDRALVSFEIAEHIVACEHSVRLLEYAGEEAELIGGEAVDIESDVFFIKVH